MWFVRFHRSARARKGTQIVMGGIAVIFVMGAVWQFGRAPSALRRTQDKVVFSVNGQKVHGSQFWPLVDQVKQQTGASGVDSYYPLVYYAMTNVIRDAVTGQQSSKLRLDASPDELKAKAAEYREQQRKMAGTGTDFKRFLYEHDLTEGEFNDNLAKQARSMQQTFRRQVVEEKLQGALAGDVQVSDAELLAKYRKFRLSHIYVKAPTEAEVQRERDSEEKRKADERQARGESAAPTPEPPEDPSAPAWLKRTPEEAQTIARDAYDRLTQKHESFAAVAKDVSDEEFTKSSGGDWGEADYNRLQSLPDPVRDVLYGMSAGQTGEPIQAKDGWHIIRLDSVKDETIPPDFDETKEDLRKTELKSKQQRRFSEAIQDLADNAAVDVADDEPRVKAALVAFDERKPRSDEQKKAARAEALALVLKYIDGETKRAGQARDQALLDYLAPDYFFVGTLYMDDEQWGDALEAFQQANTMNPLPEVQVPLARCLAKLDRKPEALKMLKSASKDATPVPSFLRLHQMIAQVYFESGDMELALDESRKVQEAQQSQAGGLSGMMGGAPLDLGD